MASLSSLYRKLSEYQNFKSNVNGLIANLKEAIEPLNIASRSLLENYQYDNVSADKNKIITNKTKLNGIIASLENEIMPAINSKIMLIKKEIADEETKVSLGNMGN